MSVSAIAPNGVRWFLYASDETPTLTPTRAPAPGLIADNIYDDVVFLSTNKTAARRWIVDNVGTFSLKVEEVPYGRTEYVEFLTPADVRWVVGLNDDGTLYTELFTSNVPKARQLVTTVMHKGKMVWVSDNRLPPPRRT